MKKVLLVGAMATLLIGCNKEQMGTSFGALGGAIIGSTIGKGSGNLAAVGLGAIFGAAIGNSIGSSMDKQDQSYYNQSTMESLEYAKTGQSTTWINPDSGNKGKTTISKTYQNRNGRYCREFQQTITVGGTQQQGYGTACRQPDGDWEIVS